MSHPLDELMSLHGRPRHFKLEGQRVVVALHFIEWALWVEHADRHVADDYVNGVRVSTVFLGLDHSWGSGPPILFETMIFGGWFDGWQRRYATWDQAETGHAVYLQRVRRLRFIPKRIQEFARETIRRAVSLWWTVQWKVGAVQ